MKTSISNSKLTAIINHNGAELISLQSNETKKEYMWKGDELYWGRQAPLLFPIVGILKNNTYSYNDSHYNLDRHGFARNQQFDLISHKQNEAIFCLKSNEFTFKIYPFLFELIVVYTLVENELCITYKVKNNDSNLLPFSIGGHPAFALSKKFDDYSLKFEFPERLISHQLANELLTENTVEIDLIESCLPLSYSLFENDALIFKKIKSKKIQILENNIPILNFKYNDFPSIGIWTKVNAPFICLEPWAGYADKSDANGNILEKEGIQILESNLVKEFHYSIAIL